MFYCKEYWFCSISGMKALGIAQWWRLPCGHEAMSAVSLALFSGILVLNPKQQFRPTQPYVCNPCQHRDSSEGWGSIGVLAQGHVHQEPLGDQEEDEEESWFWVQNEFLLQAFRTSYLTTGFLPDCLSERWFYRHPLWTPCEWHSVTLSQDVTEAHPALSTAKLHSVHWTWALPCLVQKLTELKIETRVPIFQETAANKMYTKQLKTRRKLQQARQRHLPWKIILVCVISKVLWFLKCIFQWFVWGLYF